MTVKRAKRRGRLIGEPTVEPVVGRDGARRRERRERALVRTDQGEEGGELGWALRAVLTRYGDVMRDLATRLKMPLTDVAAIEQLMQDPSLGAGELALRLGITPASATALVDRLERAGHVLRRAHESDRRRRVLVVTPRARHEVMAELAPLFAALEAHDQSLDEATQRLVERYLRGVVDVYDRFLGSE